MIQLPPYNDGSDREPAYDYTIVMDDIEYRIVLQYRERPDRWYLYLYDADNTVLLAGKKLTIDTLLLAGYEIDGLPPGDIMLIDTADTETECGFEDLGVRCELYYITEDEMPTASGNNLTIEAVP